MEVKSSQREAEAARETAAEAQVAMHSIAKESQESMREIGRAVQDLQQQHGQEVQELEARIAEQQQAATGKCKPGGSNRIELERAAMGREDARALCVEQQGFVRVCTIAEKRRQKQVAKIAESAAEIRS